MSVDELMRFNRGNELVKEIEIIKKQIDNIKSLCKKSYYPRTESNWKLSIIINDSFININLNSEEFWKCIETLMNEKHKKLKQLQQEFNKL